MATTKKDKDPSRAERKLKKRKLEEAIPDLPGDVSATDLQDASLSLPTMDGEHSTKKRKLAKSSNHDVGSLHRGEYGIQQKKSKGEKKGKRTLKESMANLDETEHLNGRASGSKLESLHGNLKRDSENLADSALPIDDVPPAKKTKKDRKAERKVAEAARVAARNKSAPPPTEDAPVVGEGETLMGKSKKNNRNREKKRKGINGNGILEKAEGKPSRFIVFIGKLNGHLHMHVLATYGVR
jgi:nucleolar protein 6